MPSKSSQKLARMAEPPPAAEAKPAIEWLWTWGGVSFGYRDGDSLFTYEGVEVGRFRGREIYGTDGHYLGETGMGREAVRLITNSHKRSQMALPFVPTLTHGHPREKDRPAMGLYSGHVDFPPPTSMKGSGSWAATGT